VLNRRDNVCDYKIHWAFIFTEFLVIVIMAATGTVLWFTQRRKAHKGSIDLEDAEQDVTDGRANYAIRRPQH
jgi:hypothetical protein